MATSQSPPTFSAYFDDVIPLLPTPVRWKWGRNNFITKLRLALARMYWKERDPVVYLKCLCSIATPYLEIGFKQQLGDYIKAPAKCAVTTSNYQAASVALCVGEQVDRYLNRMNQQYPLLAWADGKAVTEHVRSHVAFIWTAAMAVANEEMSKGATAEHHAMLKACVRGWIEYLEHILRLQVR